MIKELAEDNFQLCIKQWKICMKHCWDKEGVYIDGDNN